MPPVSGPAPLTTPWTWDVDDLLAIPPPSYPSISPEASSSNEPKPENLLPDRATEQEELYAFELLASQYAHTHPDPDMASMYAQSVLDFQADRRRC